MKLLQHEALLLSYGGSAQYKIVGIGLVIAGICFGLLPLVLYFAQQTAYLSIYFSLRYATAYWWYVGTVLPPIRKF